MSDKDRMARWANRRSEGGGSSQPQPPAHAVPSQPPAPSLPPAPAGYAYAWRPDVNAYILVSIQPAAPAYQPQPGYSQHYSPQQPPPRAAPSRRIETCQIVRPGADPYADMMANVPELVPDLGLYDSMRGNPSPDSVEALHLAGQTSQEVISDVLTNLHGEIRYGAGKPIPPKSGPG